MDAADLEEVREGLRRLAALAHAMNIVLSGAIAAEEAKRRAAAKTKKPKRKRAPRLRWEKTADDSTERLGQWEADQALRIAKTRVLENKATIRWATRLADGRKPRRKRR